MFSRLFKTPKSSLQLFRKNQAAMLPNDAESPQVLPETFSSLPIIRKVGLAEVRRVLCLLRHCRVPLSGASRLSLSLARKPRLALLVPTPKCRRFGGLSDGRLTILVGFRRLSLQPM